MPSIVVTLGLQSSASTWIYNVSRAILQRSKLSLNHFECQNIGALVGKLSVPSDRLLIKAHSIDHQFFHMLRPADAFFIISKRDPRDAVVSLNQRIHPNQIDALKNVVRSLAAVLTAENAADNVTFTYESRFFEDLNTIKVLSESLRVNLTESDCADILNKNDITATRRIVENLAAGHAASSPADSDFVYDPATLFNSRHLGDTLSNKWIGRYSTVFTDELRYLFDDIAEVGKLRKGVRMTFTEAAFFADLLWPPITGPGLQLMNGCYLAKGMWQINVRGSLPADRPIEIYVCQSGRIIFSGKAQGSEMISLDFEHENVAYDNELSLYVNIVDLERLDFDREDRFRLCATFLG